MKNNIKSIMSDLSLVDGLYGIGGSYMLYERGLVELFNDLDIVCDANAYDQIQTMWSSYEKPPTCDLFSEKFTTYIIYGISVDVMCNMNLPPFSDEPLTFSIEDWMVVQTGSIVLMSLESWLVIYRLLNRTEKVELISNYFNENEISSVQFAHLMQMKLPSSCTELIKSLIST